MKLLDKYKGRGVVKYRVVAEGEKFGTSKMRCSLCGNPVNERVDVSVDEVICHLCLMGLAEYRERHKEGGIDPIELLDEVKGGRLEKYRLRNGLTRGDMGHYLHLSTKYLQRVENLPNYPIDRLVKAIKKRVETVQCA